MNLIKIAFLLTLSLYIIIGLYTCSAIADDQPYTLEEITVTGTRTERDTFWVPSVISTVTPIEIGRRSLGTASDLLREEAGVEVQKTTAGQGSPIIRGLTGYHTLIMIDGVRLNNSTFRSGPNQYMATIDPEQVKQIEVMRGQGSSLYGSAAMGGVINVITKSPSTGKSFSFHPYVSTKFSGADKGKIARGGFDGGYGNLSLLAGFSYKDIGDLQPGKGNDIQLPSKKFLITSETDPKNLPEKAWLVDKLKPTGWKERDADAKLIYNISGNQNVKLAYQGVRQKDIPRYDKLATKEFDIFLFNPQNRDLTYLNYTANKLMPFVDLLQTSLSYHKQEEGQEQQKAKSTSFSKISDKTNTLGASLQLDSSLGNRNKLTYGGEFYHDKINSKVVKTDLKTQKTTTKAWGTFPDGSQYWDANAYIQNAIKLLNNLEATLSGRYTYYRTKSDLSIGDPTFGVFEDSGNALTGSVGLVYGITKYLNLTLSAGQGFRAPNLNDTTGVAVTNQGIDAPSLDLKPERSKGIDIGLKARSQYFIASINYYYNKISDLIIRVPIENVYEELPALYKDIQKAYEGIKLYVKDNTDKAHIQGIELALNRLVLPPLPMVSLFGNLNFTRGEDETNKQPIRREQPFNGLLGIRWEEEKGRFWAEGFSRFAKKQDRLSDSDISDPRIPGLSSNPKDKDPMRYNPGWFTLNIRGGISLNDWTRLTLGVENITDRRYREYGSGVDAPGRNFVVGADYRF